MGPKGTVIGPGGPPIWPCLAAPCGGGCWNSEANGVRVGCYYATSHPSISWKRCASLHMTSGAGPHGQTGPAPTSSTGPRRGRFSGWTLRQGGRPPVLAEAECTDSSRGGRAGEPGAHALAIRRRCENQTPTARGPPWTDAHGPSDAGETRGCWDSEGPLESDTHLPQESAVGSRDRPHPHPPCARHAPRTGVSRSVHSSAECQGQNRPWPALGHRSRSPDCGGGARLAQAQWWVCRGQEWLPSWAPGQNRAQPGASVAKSERSGPARACGWEPPWVTWGAALLLSLTFILTFLFSKYTFMAEAGLAQWIERRPAD